MSRQVKRINVPALWVRSWSTYFYKISSYPGFSVGLHFNDGVRLNIWVWLYVFGIDYRR